MGHLRKLSLPRTFEFYPFASRVRRSLQNVSYGDTESPNRFPDGIAEIRRLLEKNKVPPAKTDWALHEALVAAREQGTARPRQVANQQRRNSFASAQQTLIDRLERLSQTLKIVSPSHQTVCNAIVNNHDWPSLDTESFNELIRSLHHVLALKSATNKLEIGQDLSDLWEALSPLARTAAEMEMRRAAPQDAVGFLSNLTAFLRSRSLAKNLKSAVTRDFALRMAEIWHSLGLKVGIANGLTGAVDGMFEQFCAAALRAVGDRTRVSRRQVIRLKKEFKTKRAA